MLPNIVVKPQSAQDTVHSYFFYPLFLSWVYESGFANFYQGLSPGYKLENQTDAGARSFPVPVADGVPQIAGQIR